MKKRLFLLMIGNLLIFLCMPNAYSEVIFQENFDNHADWNTSGQYEGNECSVGECNNSMPDNWSLYRTVPGTGGLSPVLSIRRPPGNLADHTTGTGKALIVYVESVSGVNWPGDGILGKYFGGSANYKELYFRFWIRTQLDWQAVNAYQSKVFRVFHWREIENVFQWKAESTPIYFWDFAQYGGKAAYLTAYRCDESPEDYYCSNSGNSYQKTDTFYSWGSSPTSKYADTAWHRYDFHVKMNDIGKSNGITEWWYDGNLVESHTNTRWKGSGSNSEIGWNAFALGGNSNNTWTSKGERWYAIDDVVVSTTPITSDGTGTPPQIIDPLKPPKGLRIEHQ